MLAAALIAGAPGVADASSSDASTRYMDDAKAYLVDADLAAAIIQLKNAIKADPDNVEARLALGAVYLRMGNGVSAEKEFHAAMERRPNDPSIVVELGRAYLAQSRHDAVLAEVPTYVEDRAVLAEALTVRALAYLGLGKGASAKEALLLAAGLAPDDPRILLATARVLASEDDLAGAEAMVDKALAANGDLVEALLMKGDLRSRQDDGEGATTYLDRAIAIEPGNTHALLARAAVLTDLARYGEADADLQAILSADPVHPAANHLLAVLRARQGDFTGARDALDAGGAPLQRSLPAVFLSGAIDYRSGNLEQAIESFNRVLYAEPGHDMARKLLAASLIRDGQPGQAIDVLVPLAAPGKTDVRALSLLVAAYLQSGREDEAKALLARAGGEQDVMAAVLQLVSPGAGPVTASATAASATEDLDSMLDAEPTEAQVFLALLAMSEGRFAEALAAIDGLSLGAMRDNPLVDNLRGSALLGMGDLAGARASFEAALAKRPGFVPTLLHLADVEHRAGDAAAAAARYREAMAADPRDVRAHMGLAALALEAGDDGGARQGLKDAIAADPEDAAPRVALVELHLRTGSLAAALATAQEANASLPAHPQVLRALGLAQAANGDAPGAVDTYRQLVLAAPGSADAYKLLADALATAGQLDAARDALKAALQLAPDDLAAQAARIEIELRAGRGDEAMNLAVAMRERNPDAAFGDRLVGDVSLRMGDAEAAIEAYERAFAREPSSVHAVRLFGAYRRAGEPEKAFAGLVAWVGAHGDDSAARHALAAGYLEEGRHDEAIAAYEALTGMDPSSAVAFNNLAWLYQSVGDPRARDAAERAVALAPEAPAMLDTLAWILVQGGEPERGLSLLEKAYARAPERAAIRYHRAVALGRAGSEDQACSELLHLLGAESEFSEAQDARRMADEMSCATRLQAAAN